MLDICTPRLFAMCVGGHLAGLPLRKPRPAVFAICSACGRTGVRASTRADADSYLSASDAGIHWAMIRACCNSVADLAVFSLQDVLGLGAGHWMTTRHHGRPQRVLALRLADAP